MPVIFRTLTTGVPQGTEGLFRKSGGRKELKKRENGRRNEEIPEERENSPEAERGRRERKENEKNRC